jgi:8-oxo-dGTP pyrophosphatase MutT (NUDIX family)
MEPKPQWLYNQSGVIPFRKEGGEVQILLITTIHRKRWIIPKGVIEPNHSPHESAEQEAFEEAGIKGRINPDAIGEYQYRKWGGICTVKVFLFEVTELVDEWPECDMRQRKWVNVKEAENVIREPSLKEMIRKVPELISV